MPVTHFVYRGFKVCNNNPASTEDFEKKTVTHDLEKVTCKRCLKTHRFKVSKDFKEALGKN